MEQLSDIMLTDGNPADVIVISDSETVTDGKPTDVTIPDYPGIDASLSDVIEWESNKAFRQSLLNRAADEVSFILYRT